MGDHAANYSPNSVAPHQKLQDSEKKAKPTLEEMSHYDPSFFTKLGTWK